MAKLSIKSEQFDLFMDNYRDHLRDNRGQVLNTVGEHFVKYFDVKNQRLKKMKNQEKAVEYIITNYMGGDRWQ